MFFYIFLLFIVLQRFAELVYAKRNEKYLLSRGAVEYDKKGYKLIVIMHTCFFISLILEKIYFKRELSEYWIIFFIIFAAAQMLRYLAIVSLGKFWNTKIIVLSGSSLIKKGPYSFLKHPNYIAVITEILVIPLIFSCYITCIIFSALNIFVLIRRIKIEEAALGIPERSEGSYR